MAVAGMHNVSVLESSYRGENYSPVSRRHGNQERPTTQTSSIRKMWRELEGENRFRENERQLSSGVSDGSFGCPCSYVEGVAESEEDASIDENEVENECPQNQNQTGLSNGLENHNNVCSQRSPAFGIAEKQRVRQIFREWGTKSYGGHISCVSHIRNSSRAQWVGENECKRVRIAREPTELSTRQAGSCAGIEDGLGVNHTGIGAQRSIRRLYGRQALLDLLTKFQRERKRELHSLSENRLVSKFAHRNRIQSLLKARFLLNQRFVQEEKPASLAASELGLLRQTHAVSDLRKGFLSKLDNHGKTPDEVHSDTSSDNDSKYDINEQVEENFHGPSDETVDEFKTTITKIDVCQIGKVDRETLECRSLAAAEEIHEQIAENEGSKPPPPTDAVEFVETRDHNVENPFERNQGVYHVETLGTENASRADEIMHGHYMSMVEELKGEDASGHLEGSEPVNVNDEGGWHHLTDIESDEGLDANSIGDPHGWYEETTEIDYQESHEDWYDNVLEDTTEAAAPTATTRTFYTSDDDDNGNRLELRELTSRRRVSNLLQSDFRVRLDQLIQSYVERQDQALESDDEWMLDYQEPQTVDENGSAIEEVVERTEGAHQSLPVSPQAPWGDDLPDVANWQHIDFHQHFGDEWEVISGLRTDMSSLQTRMNEMQRTLEACMNMQLELQRSVQNEVSSALKRSSGSESHENSVQKDEGERTPGKEGVCFLCCDDRFDSSPDRCGDVYICSKCAGKINWSELKESVRHP